MKGTKSDGCGRKASAYHVYPVSRAAGEGRAEFLREGAGGGAGVWKAGGGGGRGEGGRGRIFNNFRSHKRIGAYCRRGARSRRWWGWQGRRAKTGSEFELEDHIINELELPHEWLER